jgi:hypothetical protein|tara:strand:+ start:759 stop:1892 length:1134 start_codon:yes stop_codon:yes gene_type:complete
MGLLGTTTEQSYYSQSQSFTATSGQTAFILTKTYFPTIPAAVTDFDVFVDGTLISRTAYDGTSYALSGSGASQVGTLTFDSGQTVGAIVLIVENQSAEAYGGYQHVSLDDIISNFIVAYVGAEKIINRVRRADVAFHAQRALQEFSYDTFKSTKSFELEVPPTLVVPLPQDYVNYVKISWVELETGTERILYPTRNTSNPRSIIQDSDYNLLFDGTTGALLESFESTPWTKYKSNVDTSANDDVSDTAGRTADSYIGNRFGLDPETAQINGVFYIDQVRGNVHFGSNISGKTVIIKYISDSLGTDAEMVVHKFAEEAMYKHLAHAILATKSNVPEYLVARFKKEKFAATRVAKLRLSNLKSEELAQVMRNKSKQIKH